VIPPTPAARPLHPVVARLLVPFRERSRAEQVVGALVVPVLFGVLCGVVIGWSAAAYWALQVVATVGGVAGGFEHQGARAGARRGVAGGLLFGGSVLLGHALAGTTAETSLGPVPALLPAVTATFGCALGALGGRGRSALHAR
jgi:hypothetical protein